ncbi:MAG: alpha-mannosidase [Promethearchaeota archaeon]
MANEKEITRIKLRVKLDRPFHAFLNGKSWRKVWGYMQQKKIIYYLSIALGKLIQKKTKSHISEFDLYAVGQSHIDAAWLWTKLSTIRRVIITFQQVIDNFERYSFFTFSQTTPAYYNWVRRLRPKLFEKVKEYEKKGRWEIVGGMWVESDTNLPNGESLVRQRVQGQKFFLEYFGKIAKIAVLEDTFGMSAQLPQIYKKSGAEGFWTTKITWNDYSEFPFANFFWRALDGSDVFTHMYKFSIMMMIDLTMYKRTGRMVQKPGLMFDSSFSPEAIEEFREDFVHNTPLAIFYGFGDGGMGPLREEIDLMANLTRAKKLKFCNTEQFFKILRKKIGNNIPIWNDELYLELHRGCYTSQSEIKRLNRMGEVSLRNCEMLITVFSLFFKKFEYPYKKMDKLWQDLLFNQFHDILPGSSIQDVYYEQEKELQNVISQANKLSSFVLQHLILSYHNKKNSELDNSIVIVNTLPWIRDGLIKIDNKDLKIEKMLPFSFKIINVEEELNKSSNIDNELKLRNESKIILMENSNLQLTINKLTGRIISIIYKPLGKELIRKNNGLGVYVYQEKKTNWPAWEIYKNFTSNPVNIGKVKGIQILEDSESKKSIKVIYKFKKTSISHHIILTANSKQIDFKTDINVYDKYLLFKTRFPINLTTNELRGEIPYGYKIRKILPSTEYEKGKWEFPAQKYVDLSDEDFGVTIINNSRYGWSKNEKGVYLTLLHTPIRAHTPFFSHLDLVPKKERTEYVDFGFTSIEYALWLHEGDFIKSKAWQKGYEYNYPLLFEKYNKNMAKLKEFEINEKFKNLFQVELSVLSISNPNVILQVIKPPEITFLKKFDHSSFECDKDSKLLILRLFETSGIAQNDVEIEVNNILKINYAMETDLLERELKMEPLLIKDRRKLLLNFGKFEIKTIKLCISV